MSESVSLCACSTKGGMRAVSACSILCAALCPSGTSFTAASTWFSIHAHAKVCRLASGSIRQRAHANANAVACDTPTTLLAAFAENSSVEKLELGEHPQQCRTQVPILGAQLFGFAAGDEKGIPAQHACRDRPASMRPAGAAAPADRAWPGSRRRCRLSTRAPMLRRSPSRPRRRTPVPGRNETRRWAARGSPGATAAAAAATRAAASAAPAAAQPCDVRARACDARPRHTRLLRARTAAAR